MEIKTVPSVTNQIPDYNNREEDDEDWGDVSIDVPTQTNPGSALPSKIILRDPIGTLLPNDSKTSQEPDVVFNPQTQRWDNKYDVDELDMMRAFDEEDSMDDEDHPPVPCPLPATRESKEKNDDFGPSEADILSFKSTEKSNLKDKPTDRAVLVKKQPPMPAHLLAQLAICQIVQTVHIEKSTST